MGKRTSDRYLQAQEALAQNMQDVVRKTAAENNFGPAFGGRPVPGYLGPGLNWDDLAWISQEWDAIVLKGIQSVEAMKLAVQQGVQGVLLSNHGGRRIHSAPSALMTLLEIRTYYPETLDRLVIFVDCAVLAVELEITMKMLGGASLDQLRPYKVNPTRLLNEIWCPDAWRTRL